MISINASLVQKLYPLALALLFSLPLAAQCPDLVWSDEFDGTTLDENNWSYEIGDGCDRGLCGWGNQELQSYQRENATVSDGFLTITAKPETVGNSSYTSARLISRNKQDFTYGRMEARIKVPGGAGTWPAFWMLSTDDPYGTWPQSGEIDIMEYVGREPNQVLGTIHYGQPWPNNSYNTGRISLQEDVADDFHQFAVEWEENEIRWFFDDILYHTQRPEDLNGQQWPFDQDFFFILNLAVGGTLGGAVDPAAFPAELVVDYVRVYGANRPYISGPRTVVATEATATFRIGNLGDDVTVTWTVPEGATIVSGQGTSEVTVNLNGRSGTISAATIQACGNQTLSTYVEVLPALSKLASLENFDDEALLTFELSTGTLTEVANPAPDDVNNSALVGQYVRAAGSQFDVLSYLTGDVFSDAAAFIDGYQQLYVDLYTTAPVGTTVLFQLETAAAAATNYPTGRHSRYQTVTTVTGAWERIALPFLDRPDANASGTDITKLIILFAPNSNTGDTYYFDNLDLYSESGMGLFPRSLMPGFPLTASPNPATDLLQLQFPVESTGPARVDLYATDGRLLLTQDFANLPVGPQTLRLPVGQLPAGTYLARVRQGDRAASVRFVR